MKYFKPKSVTWWAGIVSLLSGLLVAASSSFGVLTSMAALVDSLTGGAAPSVMVMYGVTAIGLRGALK